MKYSHIIGEMVWSYSRITAFEDCKYRFYLKYIKNADGIRHFFSDYGSFMHLIIQKFLTGELKKNELVNYYLANFRGAVVGRAPNKTIFQNYFKQGIDYLRTIKRTDDELLGVEKEISFKIGEKEFIGFIDKLSRTDGINITDNKSRTLKPRTTRPSPTKADLELDKYLRQLYLYAVPVIEEFGEEPKRLIFNCFRSKEEIIEPFDRVAFESTKKWALDTIDTITNEDGWTPNIEVFKCQHLCDVCDQCEYYQMYKQK